MLSTANPVISSEYFLHYIWRTKQFKRVNLFLTDGRKLEIQEFGRLNTNSGPDFLNGRIRLDDMILAGHIEMHIRSSDWDLHKHQHDTAYNNVILHVVGIHDKEVQNHNGHQLITLEIGHLIDPETAGKYELLENKLGVIPCARLEPERVSENIWSIWKERLNIERLQTRVDWVSKYLEKSHYDWEAILYRQILMALGTNVNKEAFKLLSERVDYRIFMKVRHDEMAAHALVFGIAGMLDRSFDEDYPAELKNMFEFQKRKFDLNPLNSVIWKYSKMHPHNFPDIRIAQAVELFRNKDHFFSQITECTDIGELRKLLTCNNLPDYWDDHFILGVKSIRRTKKLGNNSKDLMIINGIIPVLFMYGHQQHLFDLQEKALNLMALIPSENNFITRMWHDLNINCENSRDSQALLQLKHNYCDRLRCLQCSIGHELLKGKS